MRPAPLGGGRLFLWGVDMTRRCVSARPDFRLFPLFCALFSSIGLFLRYFNDLSCIWRAPTPCKSPVFFYNGLWTAPLW
jgi:hypothetical protein